MKYKQLLNWIFTWKSPIALLLIITLLIIYIRSTTLNVHSLESIRSPLSRTFTEMSSSVKKPDVIIGDVIKSGSCINGSSIDTGGYCLNKDKIFYGGNQLWCAKLCKSMEDLFGNASVVDFGAGLGHYGRCLLRIKENVVKSENPQEVRDMLTSYEAKMKKGDLYNKSRVIKSWRGYDGAENIGIFSSGFIQYIDLGKEVDLNQRWDWAVSLEVGEHIPAEKENIFIDNVTKHACKGIILSWAVLGQGGHDHINNQPNTHIIEELKKRGFSHDEEEQINFRKHVTLGYFRNTLMVFRAEDQTRCQ